MERAIRRKLYGFSIPRRCGGYNEISGIMAALIAGLGIMALVIVIWRL